MEKLSFALGVASVLVVLMGIVITWVTLKVKNLIKINENLERYISETDRSIHNRIDKLINNPKFCLNKEKELLTD